MFVATPLQTEDNSWFDNEAISRYPSLKLPEPSGTEWDSPPHSPSLLFMRMLPKRQFGKSGLTDDLEALKAAGSFREENREATLTSITQREALENYEKSGYAAEGNHQKDPAKLTNTGKKEKFRPCLW